jgi:NAD(P) transhydrogenase
MCYSLDMSRYDYNLVAIGGGPAGEKGAAQVAYFGLPDSVIPESCSQRTHDDFRVALVERESVLGGACINTGTLPSKTLRESALFLSGAKSRQIGGGVATYVRRDITLSDFMYRAHYVQERECDRAARNMDRHRVTRIHGSGVLLDPHTVEVTDADGAKQQVTAEFILLATGSRPVRPKVIPFNEDNVWDSDSILRMKALPKSMIVIGGGVIGCEYACLFQALGIRVTLVNRSSRVLEFVDYEISDRLLEECRRAGMQIALNQDVESCVSTAGLVRVTMKSGDLFTADSMLYAAGRGGNTESLGLERLGIAVSKYGNLANVDPITYQTEVPNIYAAGDLVGRPALASTGMEQGRLAMCHAFNIRYRGQQLNPVLPAGIYTIPEISTVGETEEGLQKRNAAHVTGRSQFGDHARGQIIGDVGGMIKLIFSAPEGKLLGCTVIGENASELVHCAMACLQFQGDIYYFINTVFNYPTLSDVYKYAAYDALGHLNKFRAGHTATA